MEKENIMLIGLLALVIVGFIYAMGGFQGSQISDAGAAKSTPALISANTKSDSGVNANSDKKTSESEVSIDLTPKKFENGKLYLDMGVNTHSVSLEGYDLEKLARLEFEGKSIKPISAPELTGHHNTGTIVFETGKEIKKFKIIIKDFPEIKERVFEWP